MGLRNLGATKFAFRRKKKREMRKMATNKMQVNLRWEIIWLSMSRFKLVTQDYYLFAPYSDDTAHTHTPNIIIILYTLNAYSHIYIYTYNVRRHWIGRNLEARQSGAESKHDIYRYLFVRKRTVGTLSESRGITN